jgi:hypothetical protein
VTELTSDRPFGSLIAAAQAAAIAEAQRRFGPGEYEVVGATERGCCVHLAVRRQSQRLARWRYELDGTIVEDPHPPEHARNL